MRCHLEDFKKIPDEEKLNAFKGLVKCQYHMPHLLRQSVIDI